MSGEVAGEWWQQHTHSSIRLFRTEAVKTAGCAGVCTPCAPPGVHTRQGENTCERRQYSRFIGGRSPCAGCAPPNPDYRVGRTCERVHTHSRRSGWTPHTPHTHLSGERNSVHNASSQGFRRVGCAPRGVHTGPPGCAHVKGMVITAGGSDD